jgi:ubiquinone/menaquinone biosynthesis C-methylase UbiE
MAKQKVARDQFNQQAERFSNWSITKNTEYMKRYFDFLELTAGDHLLDVACGSGEFSIFCAQRIHSVQGIDISDNMIALAEKQAGQLGINNVRFMCHPVEKMPFNDRSFSAVICKSAFHHLENCPKVFREMFRCLKPGGKISVQDIIRYDNNKVDSYFEKLEKAIDRSHHNTLSKEAITALFTNTSIPLLNRVEVEIDLDCRDYIHHAVQSPAVQAQIDEWLEYSRGDREISGFFKTLENRLSFKRNVFLILGQKPLLSH